MDERVRRWEQAREREREWQEQYERYDEELAALEAERVSLEEMIAKVRRLRDTFRDLVEPQPVGASGTAQAASGELVVLGDLRDRRDREAAQDAAPGEDSYWDRASWRGSGPTTAQAIVELLRLEGRALAAREICEGLRTRGWLPAASPDPTRLVYGTLSRLHANRDAPIWRRRSGVYVFAPHPDD